MLRIRKATEADRAILSEICLKTGDGGSDASTLEDDPSLLGLVFVEPYLTFARKFAFVAEDDDGVSGYAVGVLDTARFNAWAAHSWFPDLCECRPEPGRDTNSWSGSDWLRHWIHNPPIGLAPCLAKWPAHGHINLLPRTQGLGIGRALMLKLFDALASDGARGIHLGVDPRNTGAICFYERLGFQNFAETIDKTTVTLVRDLP